LRKSFLDGKGVRRDGPCRSLIREIALSSRAGRDKPYLEIFDPLELVRAFAEQGWGGPAPCREVMTSYHPNGVVQSMTFAPADVDRQIALGLATTLRTRLNERGYIAALDVMTPEGLPAFASTYPPHITFEYDGTRLSAVRLGYSALADTREMKSAYYMTSTVELEDRIVRFSYDASGALESEAVFQKDDKPSTIASHEAGRRRDGWHKRVHRVGGVPLEETNVFDTQGMPLPDALWDEPGANTRKGYGLRSHEVINLPTPVFNSSVQSDRYCILKRWLSAQGAGSGTWLVNTNEPRDVSGFSDQCDTRRFLSFRRRFADPKQDEREKYYAGLANLKPGERIRALVYLERHNGYCDKSYRALGGIELGLLAPREVDFDGEGTRSMIVSVLMFIGEKRPIHASVKLTGAFAGLRLVSASLQRDGDAGKRLRLLCEGKFNPPVFKTMEASVRRDVFAVNDAYRVTLESLHSAPYGIVALIYDFEVL